MKSKVDRASLPPHKEYRLSIHHLPMKLQCETHVRESPPATDESDDTPVIENYYCYRTGSDIVKVTKITIGSQTVTLMDRISFHENQSIEEITKDSSSNSSAPEIFSDVSRPSRKERISPVVRKLFKCFEEWVRQNEPELLSIFKQVKEKGGSQEQLRETFNCNAGLREGFLRFSGSLSENKVKGHACELMKSWQSSFGPAHKQYLRDEEYLNTILSDITKSK